MLSAFAPWPEKIGGMRIHVCVLYTDMGCRTYTIALLVLSTVCTVLVPVYGVILVLVPDWVSTSIYNRC